MLPQHCRAGAQAASAPAPAPRRRRWCGGRLGDGDRLAQQALEPLPATHVLRSLQAQGDVGPSDAIMAGWLAACAWWGGGRDLSIDAWAVVGSIESKVERRPGGGPRDRDRSFRLLARTAARTCCSRRKVRREQRLAGSGPDLV